MSAVGVTDAAARRRADVIDAPTATSRSPRASSWERFEALYRVLTVAAGVALIAAAAIVPIALIAALAWWIAAAVRKRRREHALDAI